MRKKILLTALAVLLTIAIALPAAAGNNTQTPETVFQSLANAIAAWFGVIGAEVEAVSGGLSEDAATPAANDGDQTELGPIIFPGG